MKLTTIFLFAFLMQVSAATLAQKVTLKKDHITLKELFKEIRKQTGYDVLFQSGQVNTNITLNVNFKATPLKNVMEQSLKGQSLDFVIDESTVVIKEKEPTILDKLKAALAIPVTITGKVLDETGHPLPGVTVKQKSTNNVAVTDTKGNYSITVSDDKTIITFSYIGYEPQELIAKDLPTGSVITLKASSENLKEVVISKGYYDEKLVLSTGDVSVISAKQIAEQPVSDPILALEGRVPGLYVQQTSGIPGAYSTVRIMGQNSIANGNDPLYVIDGVPFSSTSLTSTSIGGGAVGSPSNGPGQGMSPFNALNPADIESIEVLKDADATAIYGSRGANGVILISTKRGKSGDTKVNIDLSQGTGQVTRMMDLLNTQQYLQMRNEAFKNDALQPGPSDYDVNGVWDATRNTNWQKVLIGNTARYSNFQGSISGGNANTQFLIGGGYNRQTTVYPGDFEDRKGSMHLSITHASDNQKFHAQFMASYLNDNNVIPSIDLTSQIFLAPDAPSLYTSNGNLNWQIVNGSKTWQNPLANIYTTYEAITNNLVSSMNLSYELLPGLQLKSSFGYTQDQMNQTRLRPATLVNSPPFNLSKFSSINTGTTNIQTWIIEPQVSYQKKAGKGQFDILIGGTLQQNIYNSQATFASNFSSDALINNPTAAATTGVNGKQNIMYRYDAIYGRIGYNLAEKYIINITGRRDGSSRFGPGKQFGNFGALGLGWIFSKENWVQNVLPYISFGKLRASYGTTGNDQIGDYQYLSTYTPDPQTYQGISGLYSTRLANPNFSWEVVKKIQFGLDLGFVKDRILISGTYYKNRDDNQLVGYPLPSVAGFTSVQANLPAVVQNSGLELSLNGINIKTQHFKWSTTINLTIPKNILLSYPNLESSSYANQYVVGKSLFIVKSFHYVRVNESSGIYEYASKGGPTASPVYPDDYTLTPEITQKFFGGFLNSFSYKGIQLDVFFQFVKQTALNISNRLHYSPGYFNQNVPTNYLSRWQQTGDKTAIGKFSTINAADPNGDLNYSDYVISDASFIRLKNLSLSYTLPTNWQKKTHLQNARIYLQGQNLFTITKYLGLDPETSSTIGGVNGVANLPTLRMITAGIQITL